MTNFDKEMANITIEDYAELMSYYFHTCYMCPIQEFCGTKNKDGCYKTWKEWLNSEAVS